MALRYMALAGFGPGQAPPRQPPLDGGALEHQEALRYSTLAGTGPAQASPQHALLDGAANVALAREEHLQAPFVGAALVALRYMALAGIEPDQAPPRQPPLDGGALERQVALRYSTLAGIEPDQASPQPAPLRQIGRVLHKTLDESRQHKAQSTKHNFIQAWAS